MVSSHGSITEPPAVAAAADGVDAVVVCVESADHGDGPNGPDAVHDHGMAVVLRSAPTAAQIVLISQIYLTRPERLPGGADVIAARQRAEQQLRRSGRDYTIIRPAWLTNEPGDGGLRLEQGDTGEGQISRADVASVAVAALHTPSASGTTFEIYAQPGTAPDLTTLFEQLAKDVS